MNMEDVVSVKGIRLMNSKLRPRKVTQHFIDDLSGMRRHGALSSPERGECFIKVHRDEMSLTRPPARSSEARLVFDTHFSDYAPRELCG
jgi:hypothetical protein